VTTPIRASDRVWRLVSGYPSGKRENRKLMIFSPQAAIDDSVDQPNRTFLVLAGFMSSASNWAAFSDDWQTALDLAPKLDYFKMSEANSLTSQFSKERGWTESKRDDRLITLTRIIKKYVLMRIHASIKIADFEENIATIPVPQRKMVSDNPYIYLFTKLITAVAIRSTAFGINEPCDFIFDEQQTICDEIWHGWSDVKQMMEARNRPDMPLYVGNRPKFENDKEFKPLQAADLFANQYRLYLEQNSGRLIVPPNKILQQLLLVRHSIEHDSTAEELKRLRKTLLEFRDELLSLNPEAELYGYADTPRERRLIRKRARRGAKKKPSSFSSVRKSS
jgi:Protein of unknown function (DUF3800)